MERLLRSKVKECRQQFKKNELVLAKYTNGRFYDAKVLQHEGTSVKVRYLDDGIIQTVKQHLIKRKVKGSTSIRRRVQAKKQNFNISSKGKEKIKINEYPTPTEHSPLKKTLEEDFSKDEEDFSKDEVDFSKDEEDFSKDEEDFSKDEEDFRKDEVDFSKNDEDFNKDEGDFSKDEEDEEDFSKDEEPMNDDPMNDLSAYNFSSSESEYEPDSESADSEFDSEDDMMPKYVVQPNSKTGTFSNENSKNNQGIVVCCTTNAKDGRHYDKRYFCFFCETLFSKLPRHWESKHSEEAEVSEIMALKNDKSKEAQTRRKNLTTKLRNLGSHKWNCNVLKAGKGILLVTYRPNNEEADPYNYTPCPTCYGYYTKTELWRHNCPLNENKKKHARLLSDSRNLLPMPIDVSEDVKTILSSMRQDIVATAAKNDPTICEFIRRMFTVKGGEQNHKKSEIRNNVREISRLLVQLRKGKDENKYKLQDFFEASLYKDIICGVKKVAGFDEDTKEYAAPELARKLGLHIKSCATIALAKSLEENNKYLFERLEQFLKLHKMNYYVDIGAQAHRNRIKTQRNKTKLLPLSKDVIKLTNHVSQIITDSIKILKSKEASMEQIRSAFVNLQQSTLTQIIVFNRRREGEVSRITVDDYNNRKKHDGDSDLGETLSKTEKALCRLLTRMEIQGKGDRNVPVLLTKMMEESIELSLKFREIVGVSSNNNFLFARCNHGSTLHYRGSDCLRLYSNDCGASNPEGLRSTKLRKQVATLSQVINLKKNELDSLANFMGHDIKIHREYYRLPDNVMQVAKLSKIFLALERGNLHHEIGKSLDEITVSVEENAFEDETKGHLEEEFETNFERTSDEEQGFASSNISSELTKRNPCRKKWSAEEKAAVFRHLSSYILRGKYPGAEAAKRCIAEEPALANRSWRNIKDFCRNQILSKNRSK